MKPFFYNTPPPPQEVKGAVCKILLTDTPLHCFAVFRGSPIAFLQRVQYTVLI